MEVLFFNYRLFCMLLKAKQEVRRITLFYIFNNWLWCECFLAFDPKIRHGHHVTSCDNKVQKLLLIFRKLPKPYNGWHSAILPNKFR